MGEDAESPLPGAGLHEGRLVRAGDTVRRPAGWWTASVQHLLRQLREDGFELAPQPLGADPVGREVLSYIPGRDQGWPFIPEILSADGAAELGALAARLRRALGGYRCPPGARWQFGEGAPGPGEAMQHGDLGPWNLLWGDLGQVTGVLDWDFAQPGDPWYDTGHLAWFTVPLMDDERARARGFPEPPDRAVRLAAFARGTGLPEARLVRAAVSAQAEYRRRIIARRSSGHGDWAAYHRMGLHDLAARDRAWTAGRYGRYLRAARGS